MIGAESLVHLHRPAPAGRPTVLLLHGRGGAEGDLVPLVDAVDPQLGVLAPRGPEPQPPGFAWFRHERIGVPIIESFDARLAQVGAWLEAAVREHGLGPLSVVGFSNGGMMAGALLAARGDLIERAALFSGAYPLPPHILRLGGLDGRPVLLGGGDADPFHPVETLQAGADAYAGAGAMVQVRLTPGGGHGISAAQVDQLRAFLGESP